MKIIISEDRIYDLIMKHINSMFDIHNIHWINGTDDDGNEILVDLFEKRITDRKVVGTNLLGFHPYV